MAGMETERLEQILNDVLANDDEIKGGAETAGIDIESLRNFLMGRPDDVWDACLAEQNSVAELEEYLHIQHERLSRVKRRIIILTSCAGAMSAALFVPGVFLFTSAFPHSKNSFNQRSAGIMVMTAAIVIAVTFVVLAFIQWSRYKRRYSKEFVELQARLKAADELLDQALREKGVRGMLREIINVQDPSYSQTLQVQQAAGLAELRDPLYEIKTNAKQRIQELLATMPGGSIGVSGPRGVGKTTLLRYFCSPRFTKQPAVTALTSECLYLHQFSTMPETSSDICFQQFARRCLAQMKQSKQFVADGTHTLNDTDRHCLTSLNGSSWLSPYCFRYTEYFYCYR